MSKMFIEAQKVQRLCWPFAISFSRESLELPKSKRFGKCPASEQSVAKSGQLGQIMEI